MPGSPPFDDVYKITRRTPTALVLGLKIIVLTPFRSFFQRHAYRTPRRPSSACRGGSGSGPAPNPLPLVGRVGEGYAQAITR
jgi:hypothetical protein